MSPLSVIAVSAFIVFCGYSIITQPKINLDPLPAIQAQLAEDKQERERFRHSALCNAYREWAEQSGQTSPGMASICK